MARSAATVCAALTRHAVPDVVIRRGRRGDSPLLAALDAESNPNPWPRERYIQACETGGAETVLVALDDHQIVGFVALSCVLDEGEIRNIAVAGAQQRQGTGRRLLQSALELMRQSGCRRCFLEVRQSNDPARHWYRSLGFSDKGLRKNYYRGKSGREDALLMSVQLSG